MSEILPDAVWPHADTNDFFDIAKEQEKEEFSLKSGDWVFLRSWH
jgi:hypothetical protein